jgi:siderophore synthetase component
MYNLIIDILLTENSLKIDGSRKVFHKKNELLESHDDDEFIKYMKMLSVVLLVYYKLVDVLAKDNLNSEEAVLNDCENFQLEEFFGTFAENEQGHLNRTLKLMRPIRWEV